MPHRRRTIEEQLLELLLRRLEAEYVAAKPLPGFWRHCGGSIQHRSVAFNRKRPSWASAVAASNQADALAIRLASAGQYDAIAWTGGSQGTRNRVIRADAGRDVRWQRAVKQVVARDIIHVNITCQRARSHKWQDSANRDSEAGNRTHGYSTRVTAKTRKCSMWTARAVNERADR